MHTEMSAKADVVLFQSPHVLEQLDRHHMLIDSVGVLKTLEAGAGMPCRLIS